MTVKKDWSTYKSAVVLGAIMEIVTKEEGEDLVCVSTRQVMDKIEKNLHQRILHVLETLEGLGLADRYFPDSPTNSVFFTFSKKQVVRIKFLVGSR